MLAHYGAAADAARVVDPNRKGTVENAIQHTQSTALKGRKFESIDEQNVWLAHWEERWAAPRIHGRKKRQVLAMFAEEKPALKPLPATRFRYFRETSHTVDDSALVQVLRVYYSALPASPGDVVTVRLYDHDLEIIDSAGQLLRRHTRSFTPGHFEMEESDRIFNPSRETVRLLGKVAKLGPIACNSAARSSCAWAARAEGPLWPIELAAPLCEGGYRERGEARARLDAADLPGAQACPRASCRRDRAPRGHARTATSRPAHPRHRGIPRLLRERTTL